MFRNIFVYSTERQSQLQRNFAVKISGEFAHIFTLHSSELNENSVLFVYMEIRTVTRTRTDHEDRLSYRRNKSFKFAFGPAFV